MTEKVYNGNGFITPLNALLGVFGSMMVILGSVWGIISRPLETQIAALKEQQVRLERRAEEDHDLVVKFAASLKEIETQFKMLSHTRNVQGERDQRLLALLWRKAYGEELPQLHYWPEVGERPTNGN